MTFGIALTAVLGAGCFHHTVMVTGAQPSNSVERWQHFLIFGLVPLSEMWDARTSCPGGIAKVESSMQLGNVLLSAITLGVYGSETVRVWCAAGGSATGPASGGGSIIIVPTTLNILRDRFPDLEDIVRAQAAREDRKLAILDSAAGTF
jgi:hypothetical protein